jgi:hypothetical protein
MSKGHGVGVVRFCSSRFPCLCCAWPFLTSSVFFCETLLPGFALPVVVAHPTSVHYQSAPKLPEHGSRRDNSNLTWTVRVRQYLLVDKIVFLGLRSDDLEEGAVLVEQQIRVSVAQDTCAFGCKHEQLVSSVGNEEGSTAVLTSFQWVASLRHLSLSRVVDFTGYVLVALGV